MPQKVLVIEDDVDISNLLTLHLRELNLEVEIIGDGQAGLQKAIDTKYSLVILDLMLPGLDGHEVCKRIRASDSKVPIIILSIKSGLIDKVVGLELGADDYLTKPFSIEELKARVKVQLRRSESNLTPVAREILEIGRLRIDSQRRLVMVEEKKIDLTAKQFDLLYFLACSPGRAYTRAELLMYVWDYDTSGYEHTIDTHVNRIRSKIEKNPSKPRYLLTVWGVGYRFAERGDLP